MAFRRGKQGFWSVRVPQEDGSELIRTLSSADDQLKDDIENALYVLKSKGMWRELAAIAAGTITFPTVRTKWATESLSTLGADLDDVDLQPYVDSWHRGLQLKYGTEPRPGLTPQRTTPAHYLSEVRRLIPAGIPFRRSAFTATRITTYLAERPGAPATKSRARAAISSFGNHLVAEQVFKHNPVRDVPAPKVEHGEPSYLARHESDRLLAALVDTAELPVRTMEALTHATGMEMAALRNLRVDYLDLRRARCRARGTKKPWRDRTVDIEPWALPYLSAHLARRAATLKRALRPSDLVFPGLDDEKKYLKDVYREHIRACEAVGITDYTFHDARHSFAVRYVAAGVPDEYPARQLGHKNTKQVRETYGRFRPSALDAARYQAMVAARDAEQQHDAETAGDLSTHAVDGSAGDRDNESRYTPAIGVGN